MLRWPWTTRWRCRRGANNTQTNRVPVPIVPLKPPLSKYKPMSNYGIILRVPFEVTGRPNLLLAEPSQKSKWKFWQLQYFVRLRILTIKMVQISAKHKQILCWVDLGFRLPIQITMSMLYNSWLWPAHFSSAEVLFSYVMRLLYEIGQWAAPVSIWYGYHSQIVHGLLVAVVTFNW